MFYYWNFGGNFRIFDSSYGSLSGSYVSVFSLVLGNVGISDCADIVLKEAFLPVGLSDYAVLSGDVKKDTPITYEMVDFSEDNIVCKLRKKEENFIQK